ncbi:probable serine hydrolase [Leptinotarsa decemlineata]|uniref:probable serine hydrolase n=1 Tax=Leptinotarsa decemlineata TaxID=7539 RepID=UPI003D3056C1
MIRNVVYKQIGKHCCKRWHSTRREFKEVSIKVPWGELAGKWWEPYEERPILAVHGWQDNCSSFDRLIPLLNRNVGFLAIDLPGHGFSTRLPNGMNYHFMNYLIALRSIAHQFKWPKTSLMGHSLGGVICYTYCMLYPEDIDMVLFIDGSKPMVRKNINVRIAQAIDAFFKYNSFNESSEEPPSYSIEDMKKMVGAPNNNSVSLEYATILMERNIAPSKLYPGKFYFTRDPRLKTGTSLYFNQEDLVEYAHHMKMPMLLVKSTESSYYEPKENVYQVLDILKRTSIDFDFHYVPGTHHVHLNNPENVADLMQNFIRRHNIEDRSIGGIKDDIIKEENRKKLVQIAEVS